MAKVIPFPKVVIDERARRPRPEGCHVFIFPGVRIERHGEPAGRPDTNNSRGKPTRRTGRTGT